MTDKFFRYFEGWIDPFDPGRGKPPDRLIPYILHFVKQAPITFILALVFGGLLGIVEITLFGYVGEIVDLLRSTTPEQVWVEYGETLLWMAAFVIVIRTAVMSFSTVLDEQVIVPGFFNMVRWQNHKQVMRQSVRYFEDDFAGRIATKVAQSGQSLGDFLISLLQVIWLFLIYVLSALVLFAGLNIQLVVVLIFWSAAYAGILYHFIPRIRRSAKALAEGSAVVNGRLVDVYSNMSLVKIDGHDEREDHFVADGMSRLIKAVRTYTRNITGMRFSLNLINALMVVGIGYFSVLLWEEEIITLGAVAFALSLMLRLVILSQRMLGQFNGIFRAVGTIQNAMETITQPIDFEDKPEASEIGEVEGNIKFSSVCFRYEREKKVEVIDDVNLSIKSGEKVGLVGPSGAGKSTLTKLLLRLYEIEKGEITLDGIDINTVRQASLRRNFGVVQQEVNLFNRSILDNIAYARPDASFDDVVKAAEKARANDFILGLRDAKGREGYDAYVGERGVKLSGGQRQRIALARVILKDAPILILDEATAALDSEIEAAISDNLGVLMTNKTVIAIAHRLSTIAAMDRLVVMDEGRIVETGTHIELIEKGGLYARLWERQSGGFLVIADDA